MGSRHGAGVCGTVVNAAEAHQMELENRQYAEEMLRADPAWHEWLDKVDQQVKETEMELNDAMSFDELVPSESKYLKKEDVGEAGLILTIAGFTRDNLEADGVTEEKTIMHFSEDVKPMVLNRTNSQLIPAVTGASNAGEAKGKQIVVYNDPTVGFGGKITGGLRIKSIQAAQPAQAPQQPSPSSDIPF